MKHLFGKKTLSFEELLEKNRSVSLHYRILRIFATEMLKFVKGININLRQAPIFYSRCINRPH